MRYTLVTDGSSDAALIPILNWLLLENGVTEAIKAEWADLRQVYWKQTPTLTEKVAKAIDLHPCELLFVHRDAEKEPWRNRINEIEDALEKVDDLPEYVCVVPVRMQEAWMLFDEDAIRYAAGNPNGKIQLELPSLKQAALLPDPKNVLFELMRTASGLSRRRLKTFPVRRYVHRVSDAIDDFSPLRRLDAFASLENDLQICLQKQGYSGRK